MRPWDLARAAAVDVQDWRLVPPLDLVTRQAKHRHDPVVLGRAWSPAPQRNRQDAPLIEARTSCQLPDINLMLLTRLVDGCAFFHVRDSCQIVARDRGCGPPECGESTRSRR